MHMHRAVVLAIKFEVVRLLFSVYISTQQEGGSEGIPPPPQEKKRSSEIAFEICFGSKRCFSAARHVHVHMCQYLHISLYNVGFGLPLKEQKVAERREIIRKTQRILLHTVCSHLTNFKTWYVTCEHALCVYVSLR